MTADRSQPDFEEELLARFLRELESAEDRLAVIQAYTARHPAMADELARLEQMNRLVASAGRDEAADIPTHLGEFRIVRRMARGGMGDIYEAVQDRLNRRVAVKTIRRGRIAAHFRGRFFREQRVLARLHQTHIVPIHTAGEEGDLLYFAMPFIDGAALNHVVRAAAAFETCASGSKTPSLAALADRVTAAPSEAMTLAQTRPAVEPPAGRPRILSGDYFRSVAQVMADAAEAVEHAHRLNILHRDLKPSNILIDRQGQCWIIDFGLAGYLGQVGGAADEHAIDDGEALTVGGIIGTPQYMAPEQWRGEPADARTDVWGLGATLYELLTLRRAFDGPSDSDAEDRVLADEPPPPRTLVRNVPRDLAAICRKALRKNPAERYPTAQALADDLRRWLRHEPILARPARALRRLLLWTRRNPGWTAALAFAAVAVVGLGGAAIEMERRQIVQANRQTAVERRAKFMSELQQIRLGAHRDGWRAEGLAIAHEAQRIRPGNDLRDEVAALLGGEDVSRMASFSFGGSAVAFNPSETHLFVGGTKDRGGRPKEAARLIGLATGKETVVSNSLGAGPVAIRSDGSPLQLVPKDRWTLALWNPARQPPIREFSLVPDADAEPVTEFNYPTLALSADGSVAAASTDGPDGDGIVRVWDTQSGRQLFESRSRAASLAISPDNSRLAAGGNDGVISVYTIADGQRVATLPNGRLPITSLAFGRDPVRRTDGPDNGWRLAAGDSGSRITIWDLVSGQLRCRCDGWSGGVTALAFSPDGMTLASGGRYTVQVWDAASGRPLLAVEHFNEITGLAFDQSGRRLVVSGANLAWVPGVQVWKIEGEGSARTLYGLASAVHRIAFSADERYLAALTNQWQVAIWDLSEGRLLHVCDTPRGGEFFDNQALAFDPAGERLACSAGSEAVLWDVKTGRRLGQWQLKPGLQDALAFDPTGHELWSIRCETARGVEPYSHADPREYPRIYPIRNLLGPDPTTPVARIPTDWDNVQIIMATPDARYTAIEDYRGAAAVREWRLRVFALPVGKELWAVGPVKHSTSFSIDPTDNSLGYHAAEDTGRLTVVDILSRRELRTLKDVGEIGSGGTSVYSDGLHLRPAGEAAVTFDFDRLVRDAKHFFSPSGRYLALGHVDGTVVVYDIAEVGRHLAEFADR